MNKRIIKKIKKSKDQKVVAAKRTRLSARKLRKRPPKTK